jgi:hypothetical protein
MGALNEQENWARLMVEDSPSDRDRTVHVHIHRRDDSEEWPLPKVMAYVFALLIGLALVGLGVRWIQLRMAEDAVKTINASSAAASAEIRRSLAEAQQRADREKAERAAAQRRAIDEQNARIAALQDQERRREQAWSHFYVPSEFCKNPDSRATMECTNEHARAKREFDQRWAAGRR